MRLRLNAAAPKPCVQIVSKISDLPLNLQIGGALTPRSSTAMPPDVYDTSKYHTYYAKYDADPIRDFELVVVLCLRRIIFGDRLTEHAGPDAALLAQLKAEGRFPNDMDEPDILVAPTLSSAGEPDISTA